MISMYTFSMIGHFAPKEFNDKFFPGSWKHMDEQTVFKIEETREVSGWPIVIHAAVCYEGTCGHSANSYHLRKNGCRAVDFHFKTAASLREQYLVLEELAWNGIGVYPHWNYPGFHVDMRPEHRVQRWTRDKYNKYHYLLP